MKTTNLLSRFRFALAVMSTAIVALTTSALAQDPGGNNNNDNNPPKTAGKNNNNNNNNPPIAGYRQAASGNVETISTSLYPNPAITYAVLHIENASAPVTFKMYNSSGAVVVVKTVANGDYMIDRNGLSSGLYYYTVGSNESIDAKGRLLIID